MSARQATCPRRAVHCVDTEGPLHESVEATFERLQRHLRARPRAEPRDRFVACRPARSTSGASRRAVQRVVDPHLLAYNDTWDKVDAMLERLPVRRPSATGSATRGSGLGLQLVLRRPRRLRRQSAPPRHGLPQRLRPLPGRSCGRLGRGRDGLHFHYHPHSFFRRRPTAARRTGGRRRTACYQMLSRRVIDRQLVPGRPSPRFPRDPPGQPLVPRAVHPVRLLQPGDAVPTEEDRAQAGHRGRPAGATGAGRRPTGSRTTPLTTTTRCRAPAGAGSPAASTSAPVPTAHRSATCARPSRRRGRASRSCWP